MRLITTTDILIGDDGILFWYFKPSSPFFPFLFCRFFFFLFFLSSPFFSHSSVRDVTVSNFLRGSYRSSLFVSLFTLSPSFSFSHSLWTTLNFRYPGKSFTPSTPRRGSYLDLSRRSIVSSYLNPGNHGWGST